MPARRKQRKAQTKTIPNRKMQYQEDAKLKNTTATLQAIVPQRKQAIPKGHSQPMQMVEVFRASATSIFAFNASWSIAVSPFFFRLPDIASTRWG
jgi:hypothetical protein